MTTDNRKSRALIVEDDPLTRIALSGVLRELNYESIEAGDGDAGLALFQKEHPDVIFADILLPGRDGLSLISEILSEDPGAVIIAMSSGGAAKKTEFLEWAAKLGAAQTLNKPFKPDDVRRVMNSI